MNLNFNTKRKSSDILSNKYSIKNYVKNNDNQYINNNKDDSFIYKIKSNSIPDQNQNKNKITYHINNINNLNNNNSKKLSKTSLNNNNYFNNQTNIPLLASQSKQSIKPITLDENLNNFQYFTQNSTSKKSIKSFDTDKYLNSIGGFFDKFENSSKNSNNKSSKDLILLNYNNNSNKEIIDLSFNNYNRENPNINIDLSEASIEEVLLNCNEKQISESIIKNKSLKRQSGNINFL
jgi:hypothetical protein